MEQVKGNNRGRLTWSQLGLYTSGAVQAEVTVAQGRHGELFSYRVQRLGDGGRVSSFFRPGDLGDFDDVMRQVGMAILERKTNGAQA